jgi:tetratricopeptide (TPR) repeat protein
MRKTCLLAFLLLAVAMSSCASLHKQAGDARSGDASGAAFAASPETKGRIAALVEARNYSGALELMAAESDDFEPDVAFPTEFGKALNGLAEKGVQYYSEEDYASAGITLRQALDNYPSGAGQPPGLRHSAEEINALVKACAERLREEGFREYRNGNLGNAIAHWRRILFFSKEDATTINKMIETATVQLKNLRKLETER